MKQFCWQPQVWLGNLGFFAKTALPAELSEILASLFDARRICGTLLLFCQRIWSIVRCWFIVWSSKVAKSCRCLGFVPMSSDLVQSKWNLHQPETYRSVSKWSTFCRCDCHFIADLLVGQCLKCSLGKKAREMCIIFARSPPYRGLDKD